MRAFTSSITEAGTCPICNLSDTGVISQQAIDDDKVEAWPGLCPVCNTNLLRALDLEQEGYAFAAALAVQFPPNRIHFAMEVYTAWRWPLLPLEEARVCPDCSREWTSASFSCCPSCGREVAEA